MIKIVQDTVANINPKNLIQNVKQIFSFQVIA